MVEREKPVAQRTGRAHSQQGWALVTELALSFSPQTLRLRGWQKPATSLHSFSEEAQRPRECWPLTVLTQSQASSTVGADLNNNKILNEWEDPFVFWFQR